MYYTIKIEIDEVGESSTQAGVVETPKNILRLSDTDDDLQSVVNRAEKMLSLYKKEG